MAQFSELRSLGWRPAGAGRKLRSMLRCLIALTALVTAGAAAAPAWTWVDANGQRHFSDRPVPGAEQIELQESLTFSRPAAQPRSGPAGQTTEGPPAGEIPYTRFDITSPKHQETLWNLGGSLNVQLDIAPGLQTGHRIDMFLDGQRLEIGARSPQLTVPEMYRGLHTLQAAIFDATGREVLRTQEITVMVQQTSLLNPNGPSRPNTAGGARN